MLKQISLDKLEEHLVFLNKMYDAVRLVDPIQKRVLECRNQAIGKTSELCYDYWKSGAICDNCISVRAHHDNISYMKIEQNANVIMVVTALPVDTAEQPVILELLKDVTDSMVIGTGDYNIGQAVNHLVYDLNSMAVKDHLTGVHNRRFVDDRLPVDIIRATVAQQPLSIIFIDIDNMKIINDTYGHPAGDIALKEVAAAMTHCIRTDVDWVARFGGDEFVVCLNNTDYEGACYIAERLRSGIGAIEMSAQGVDIAIGVSLGVQTMVEPVTAEELLRVADEKMYKAKKNGKHHPKKAAPDEESP
ncbi:MAG: GGDEF domain-containing protein [Clostridiales bacterium]|nr:GGDEF domain-containing protein [Clostridiales bacterium]